MLFVSLSAEVQRAELEEVSCPAGLAVALHLSSHRNWIEGWMLCCCDHRAYIRVRSRPMVRFGTVDGTRKKMVVVVLRQL